MIMISMLLQWSALAEPMSKPVFDTTGYLHKNPENKSFFIPMQILYQGMLLRQGPDIINTEFLTQYAKKLPYSKIPYILDIECWNVRPNVSDMEADANIDKLILVIKTLKEARPDLKFGYYGELPTRDYVSPKPAIGIKYQKWHNSNVRLKRLAEHVDVICPDLYTHFDDVEGWKQYASAAVKEARMYGKPIYPFIWMEFHDAHEERKGKYIDARFWEQQLLHLNKIADGIIIWGGRDVTVQPHTSKEWNEYDPWWITTKDFILHNQQSSAASAKEMAEKKSLVKPPVKASPLPKQKAIYMPASQLITAPANNPKPQFKKIEIIKE